MSMTSVCGVLLAHVSVERQMGLQSFGFLLLRWNVWQYFDENIGTCKYVSKQI